MPRNKDKIVKSFRYEGRRYSVSAETEKEALKKMAIKRKEVEEGKCIIESGMPLRQWVEVCYSKYKTNISDVTRKRELQKVNKWVVEPLGKMPLKRIKPLDIQDVMNQLQGYSEAHIKKIHQVYVWLFDKAIENGLLINNPAKAVTRPKGESGTHRAITDQERKHFLLVADKEPKLVYFLFMLYCGCRPSEVANIKGMDIQTDAEGLPVLHIRGTKTKNADRIVPIPPELYRRLPHIDNPFDYLFTTTAGKPLNEQARKRRWNRCKRELNISMGCKVYNNELVAPFPLAPDLVPYCLRHTYCTDLAKKDVDIRTAQYLMGHSNIDLTAEIYTHIDNSMVNDVAKKMWKHGVNAEQLRVVK